MNEVIENILQVNGRINSFGPVTSLALEALRAESEECHWIVVVLSDIDIYVSDFVASVEENGVSEEVCHRGVVM